MIATAFPDVRETADDSEGSELLEIAHRVLCPARMLLDHFGAPMLTVARCRDRIRVAPWTQGFVEREEISDALAARSGLTRALAVVRLHGGEACGLLAQRWPVNGTPPIIGIVTDGIGVAVSGGHPSALTQDWLIDHVAGRARIDMLIPFGASASLLVQTAAPDDRLH